MATVTLSAHTYDRITDLAAAWGIPDDAVIARLLDFFKKANAIVRGEDDGDRVLVHAVYVGQRAEGVYRPSIGRIDIVSGSSAGATGLKPSPAAGEVVRTVQAKIGNEVRGSRNGWDFWIVTATGQPLRSIRPNRN